MTYSTTKFKVATSNGLEGDTFTRNVTDGRTHRQTDRRTDGRTDFNTKLIYPFFLKKKPGIIIYSPDNLSTHDLFTSQQSKCILLQREIPFAFLSSYDDLFFTLTLRILTYLKIYVFLNI